MTNLFVELTRIFGRWQTGIKVNSKDVEKAFYSVFGRMLSEARRRRRISQEALADELGLTRTSITNIEKGRQPIQLHTLYKISRLLRMDVKELLPSGIVFDRPQDAKGLSVSRSEWLETMSVLLEKPPGNDDDKHRQASSKTARGK